MKFDQLLKKKRKTVLEKTYMAAIASVSTKKGFSKMTFSEIHTWLEARGRRLFS